MILGYYYLNGIFVEKDIEKGKAYLNKAIAFGDKDSKYIYARFNIDYNVDIEKGVKYLKDLIKDKFEMAELYYAKLLLNPKNELYNVEESLEILISLVDRGYSRSIIEYANMLIEGKIVNQDIEKGLLLLDNEIKKANSDAMIVKGEYLLERNCVQDNIEEGIRLLEKASKYNDEALINLGLKYVYGICVEKNYEKGLDYLRKAISKGNLVAKVSYARILLHMKNADAKTKKESLIFLDEAVKARFPSAQVLMAEILFDGEIIDKNIDRAKKLLEVAKKRFSTSQDIIG